MKIIEYIDCHNMIIEFDDGFKTNTDYVRFEKRLVPHPYEKSYFNKGYIGDGNYNTLSPSYICWRNMLIRCYDKRYHKKYPT